MQDCLGMMDITFCENWKAIVLGDAPTSRPSLLHLPPQLRKVKSL